MAATFQWCEANGPDQVLTEDVESLDWKSKDDTTTDFRSAPIVAGDNSYDKWLFGKFTGAFTNIFGGLFSHTTGELRSGIRLNGPPSMMSSRDALSYSRPSTQINEALTSDMTLASELKDGLHVWFGPNAPDAPGKAPSTRANPAYTNFLTMQLQTDWNAKPAEEKAAFTFRWDEN